MPVIPQIHNNGTSQAELIRQISEANTALNQAIEALAKMTPNARDYYLTGNYTEAREAHLARMQALYHVQDEIMAIGEGIADQ